MLSSGSNDDRSRGGRWGRARASLACVILGLVAWLSVFGCGTSQPPPGPGSSSGPETSGRDPFAFMVTIDDSGDVDSGTVDLSKSAGSRIQWWNKSSDTMLIILKDSHISEIILPRRFSSPHRVCLDCDTGYYHYDIKRLVFGQPRNPRSGAPGEPQVGVGD